MPVHDEYEDERTVERCFEDNVRSGGKREVEGTLLWYVVSLSAGSRREHHIFEEDRSQMASFCCYQPQKSQKQKRSRRSTARDGLGSTRKRVFRSCSKKFLSCRVSPTHATTDRLTTSFCTHYRLAVLLFDVCRFSSSPKLLRRFSVASSRHSSRDATLGFKWIAIETEAGQY